MALTVTLSKYANEDKVLFNFDFTLHTNIVAGQTLAGTPVITASPAGLTIGTPVIDATGKIVQAAFSGGVADTLYSVECEAATDTAGTVLVICGKLYVKAC